MEGEEDEEEITACMRGGGGGLTPVGGVVALHAFSSQAVADESIERMPPSAPQIGFCTRLDASLAFASSPNIAR